MTEKAEKKEQCKQFLRALLISAPAALTIDEVKRDYRDLVGDPIPFRKFGYVTLEDFFEDIPDVVHITWNRGVMCLKVVADESTAHIQKLVSKQKISNKNKYQTLRKGGPPPQKHRSGPPRPTPTVPAFIRKCLDTLFRSYPDGLPFTHFEQAFSKRFNTQLQYCRLGFNSLKELLQAVPDILSIQDFGGEVRVVPVCNNYNNVNRQKNMGHDRFENKRPPLLPTPKVAPNLPPRLQKKKEEESYQRCNMNSLDPIPEPPRPKSSNEKYIPPHLREGKPAAPRGRGKKISCSGDRDSTRQRNASEASSGSTGSTASSCSVEVDSSLNPKLTDEICQLIRGNEKGVWVIQLQMEYQNTYSKHLNPLEFGYNSIIELCSALPESILIVRAKNKGDWLLWDASLPLPNIEGSDKSKDHKGQRADNQKFADPKLKETIRQVLQCKPSGVVLQELPQVYKELTGEDLPWKELEYSSMESFALSLADSVLQFEYKGNNQILLFPISNGNEPKTDLLKYAPAVVPKQFCLSSQNDIPEDAVGPATHYHQLDLPPCGEYIEVYVSNVVSPGLFWLQIRGKHTTIALEKLMNQLEATYTSANGERYTIPDNMLSVGLLVAAIFPEDSNWHRCVITAPIKGQYIEVYFVDYGNTCLVHTHNLRFLRSKYLKLPGQALQGRLSNIQPVSEKWSINARNKMLQMVVNKPLIAMVTSQKDNILSICLTDTSGKEDIHINDVLINEGYAVFQPDTYDTDFMHNLDISQIPNYSHVFGEPDSNSTVSQVTQISSTTLAGSTTDTITDSSLSCTSNRHYVLQLDLTTNNVVHLINVDGLGYLPSRDISAFFWDSDILGSMIQRNDLDIQCVKVSHMEHPALFDELQKYGMSWWNEVQGQDLSLYEINSIPLILEEFEPDAENHDSELKNNILQLIQAFDPDDPYWKGEEYIKSEEQENEQIELLNAEQIQLMLQTLQFRRKRILQVMLSGENIGRDVDELHAIDRRISDLKHRINLGNKKAVAAGSCTETAKRLEGVEPTVKPTNVAMVSPTKQKPVAMVSSMQKTNVVAPMPNVQSTLNPSEQITGPASVLNFPPALDPTLLQSPDPTSAMNLTLMNNFACQSLLLNQALSNQTLSAGQTSTNTSMLNAGLNQDYLSLMQASLMNPLFMSEQPGTLGTMNPIGASMGRGQNLRMASPLNFRLPGPQNISNVGMTNSMGSVPQTVGGTAGMNNSMGLLPGLLPLFQRMALGGSSDNSNQTLKKDS